MKISDIIGGVIAYLFLVFVVYSCMWGNPFKEDNEANTYISPSDKALIQMMEKDHER